MVEVRIVTEPQEMEDAYSVRRNVFIDEQQVPEEIEIDEHEKDSIHFIVYVEGEPVGAGRLRLQNGYGKAERVSVVKSHRGKGVGEMLMRKMEVVVSEKGLGEMKLNAQTHAEGFYQRIGYETCSDVFLDAGIPHVAMKKKLD